ncbi:MAG: amino acid permease [Deltaproteobacteria bacterium]|nr:amino acid permease [Deltaproteobacteria bacterium]
MNDPRTTGGEGPLERRFGLLTATGVVAASMIGTGVFTTTGLLSAQLEGGGTVLLAWLLGGLFALCGALAYGELAASISRNGGEYRFLAEAYHPAVGFAAGFISLVVGFSAPTAASAVAFGKYLEALVPGLPASASAVVLILGLAALHTARVKVGAAVQDLFVVVKIGLILVFLVGAAFLLPAQPVGDLTLSGEALLGSPFAVGLIFVAFAYSGWNGAAYLAGEVREPARTLPLALLLGTGLVTLLYLGLNLVFLLGLEPAALKGTVEVGHLAAVSLFGEAAGRLLSTGIALALVSSVSALLMVGPRVYEAMGEDHRPLRFLRLRPDGGGPAASIVLQAALALVLVLTLSFDALLMYIGFTLSLSAALTVAGVFVLRRRQPDLPRPYRTWGYPLTPLLFVGFALWMIVWSVGQRPREALLGVATIVVGLLLHALLARGGRAR